MTKRIVSGIFILTALGALGVILAGALTSGEQLIVRFLTAVIVAALGLYVISDLRLQADDDAVTTRPGGHPRMSAVDAPPNSTAAFMATVTKRSEPKKADGDTESAEAETELVPGTAGNIKVGAGAGTRSDEGGTASSPRTAIAKPAALDGTDTTVAATTATGSISTPNGSISTPNGGNSTPDGGNSTVNSTINSGNSTVNSGNSTVNGAVHTANGAGRTTTGGKNPTGGSHDSDSTASGDERSTDGERTASTGAPKHTVKSGRRPADETKVGAKATAGAGTPASTEAKTGDRASSNETDANESKVPDESAHSVSSTAPETIRASAPTAKAGAAPSELFGDKQAFASGRNRSSDVTRQLVKPTPVAKMATVGGASSPVNLEAVNEFRSDGTSDDRESSPGGNDSAPTSGNGPVDGDRGQSAYESFGVGGDNSAANNGNKNAGGGFGQAGRSDSSTGDGPTADSSADDTVDRHVNGAAPKDGGLNGHRVAADLNGHGVDNGLNGHSAGRPNGAEVNGSDTKDSLNGRAIFSSMPAPDDATTEQDTTEENTADDNLADVATTAAPGDSTEKDLVDEQPIDVELASEPTPEASNGFEYSGDLQSSEHEWPSPPKQNGRRQPHPFEKLAAVQDDRDSTLSAAGQLARTTLPVPAANGDLQAVDYADAPLAPIIDLRDVNGQNAENIDTAINAGEVEVIATLIEQGMLSTDGPISDRDVRTMVYVAFTSNELRKLLLAGGTPDGPNYGLDLGPVELFDERVHAPAPKTLYSGIGRPEAQSQLG